MDKLIGIFLIIIVIVGLIMFYIFQSIKKYSKNILKKETSGFEIANDIIEKNNKKNYIVENKGFLSDMYDYDRNIIKLNERNFNDKSITSACIAAFYATIAINNNYLNFRNRFEKIIKYTVLIMYVLFVLAIFINDYRVLMMSFVFEIIIVIYYLYITYMNKMIIEKAKDSLIKNKLFKENEIVYVDDFYKKYLFIDLCKIITYIFNI